jgi:hypothetical protein
MNQVKFNKNNLILINKIMIKLLYKFNNNLQINSKIN